VQIESVNIGQGGSMRLGGRIIETGIDKRPVESAFLSRLGLEGDLVADTENHGGADQAVYVYSREDYGFWEAELGSSLAPGSFGENLTLSSVGDEPLRVGDRFRVGAARIEVTAPRIPCATFATHMTVEGWVKRFREAERPGFYARVLMEGVVRAGDPVEREPAAGESLELLALFRLWYERDARPETVREALASPLAERARRAFEGRLASVARPAAS
jgi:MOSC domain-containing protein YiiM